MAAHVLRNLYWFSLILLCVSSSRAEDPTGIVIISNRTTELIRTEIRTSVPSVIPLSIEPGALVTVDWRAGAKLLPKAAAPDGWPLTADTILVLQPDATLGWKPSVWPMAKQLPWDLSPAPANARAIAEQRQRQRVAGESATIRIQLLADDDERTSKANWSKRFGQRIQAASQVLEYHVGLQLKIVSIEEWVTANTLTDFNLSLKEFETNVRLLPENDLVIGFSSQYELERTKIHLGGTRGMLSKHILLRESSKQMTESEKLEVLVHEIGHFLGAAHATELNSVMRPVLADRQSRDKRFRIFYDPLNTLAMNLVAREYRAGVRSRYELSQPTRQALLPIYGELYRINRDDPAIESMLDCIGAVRVSAP